MKQLKMNQFKKEEYYFSYSGLNKLLYSPVLFYNHYILGEKEDRLDSYMVEGRLSHCLLLEPDEFDKQFIVAMDKLPSDNAKIIMDRLCKQYSDVSDLDDLHNEILSIMAEMNYFQNLKTDEQRIAKLLTDDVKKYHKFVFESQGKTVIDSQTKEKISAVVDTIRKDPEIIKVLHLDNSEFDTHIEIYNEIMLQSKLDGYVFPGIKGILDNLIIDHSNKIATINDFKTTGKTLMDFKDTVDYYNYSLQMGIYHMLVQNLLKEKGLDYDIAHNFIVIDKYNQYYVFPVGINTFREWLNQTKLSLQIANYHLNTDNYSLPYALLKEKVYL
jgi:hypothetical protein